MPDAHKNFAYSTVATAPSPAISGTSLVVAAGEGALFPTVPFNVTIWPVGEVPKSTNAEIARVTNISTDTLTITRAQEGTSARTVVVGDQIAATITAQGWRDAEDMHYETRSTNTILGVADKGKTIDITATITQTFEADETLGDGWWVVLRNATTSGTVVVTLNPDGAETIDGIATPIMYAGETRRIMCNGAGGNFNSVLLHGGFVRFDANGSFQIPAGVTKVWLNPVGAGGGGGGGRGASAGALRQGGGAGGGGAGPVFELRADELGAAGSTISLTVGTGGNGGNGGSAANGSVGSPGGSTTFGNYTAFGGGGGSGGTSTSQAGVCGGGGGGISAVGGAGTTTTDTQGGGATIAGVPGTGYEGAGVDRDSPNFAAAFGGNFGGASGGGARGDGATAASTGGCSIHGGGGGGGGGGLPTGNSEQAAGAGGGTGRYTTAAIGGGAGSTNGGTGSAGTDFGDGGGGGGAQDSGTGGLGGAGAIGGGGGGGGGGGTTVGGAGGAGGNGGGRAWYT